MLRVFYNGLRLLTALCSAALWRQFGGSAWRLPPERSHLVETAQRLLGRSLATACHGHRDRQ